MVLFLSSFLAKTNRSYWPIGGTVPEADGKVMRWDVEEKGHKISARVRMNQVCSSMFHLKSIGP